MSIICNLLNMITYISAVIGILLAFLMGRYVCKSTMRRFIYVFCIKRFKDKNNNDSDEAKKKKFKRYVELFNWLCEREGIFYSYYILI